METENQSPRRLLWLIVALALLLALGIRLYDLDDPPLDFHPTRQLRNAIVARGLYYAWQPHADPATRALAANLQATIGIYEPPISESLAALGYLIVGGESLAVPRVIHTLIWLLGGGVLFALARRTTSTAGALFALGYYLFLPFGVQASRAFQPDPLMTVGIVFSIYAFYRWSEERSWRWALLAGLTGALAVLIKIVAAYLIGGMAVAGVLYLGWRKNWRNPQVWVLAALMILPPAAFYLGRNPGSSADYFTAWTLSLIHLIADPGFYVRWLSFLSYLMSLALLFLGAVGVLISKSLPRALLLGLWSGYFLYGLTLPYQMYTHDYYHIQLIPVLALSLAPVAELLFEKLNQLERKWRTLSVVIALVALFYPLWTARSTLAARDYRHEPAYWAALGEQIPDDGAVIALTQDYGYRLMYYGWTHVSLWPSGIERELTELRGGDTSKFASEFAERTADKRYFLVTAPSQLAQQPALQATLDENYPLIARGEGYLLYDLEAQK